MVRDIRSLMSYRLAMLAGLNDRSGHAHLKETFGITLGEWRVFGNIAARGPLTPAELARGMNIDRGQLSRTVAELVRRGWVTTGPQPGDRRTLILKLTAAGRARHDRILAFAAERNRAVLSILSRVEQQALDSILQKLTLFVEAEYGALDRGSARQAEQAARGIFRKRTA